MTKTAMVKERNAIGTEYNKNRHTYTTGWVEKTKGYGFGEFAGTGEFYLGTVYTGEQTMEQWNPEKAARYKYLNEQLADWEAEKKRKAKVRRYKKEIVELEDRLDYLKRWLAENEG